MAPIKFLLFLTFAHAAFAKENVLWSQGSESTVECGADLMKVAVPMDGDRKITYLDQLKDYKPCQPELDGNIAYYELDLQDPHECGVTRVLNKKTGQRTFYHKIVIENTDGSRETVKVKCYMPGKLRISRDIRPFPLDFDEPDVLNITRSEEGKAPEPVLGAIVKQNGKQVSGEISVTPGTPLTMEIYLDEQSAPIYGLLVNYMHVTDTGKQQETIILNGCSVDPYLFDNFVTTDGDTLSAKFKAFKFPDTTYVQFKGTVTVCLDKCQGVQCTNGKIAYGRKRRSIGSTESNKLYEVSLTTFIKVDYDTGKPVLNSNIEDYIHGLGNLRIENQLLGETDGTPATVAEQTSDNKLIDNKLKETKNSTNLNNSNMAVYSTLLIVTNLLLLNKLY